MTGAPVLFLDFDGVLHPGSGLSDTRLIHAKTLDASLAQRVVGATGSVHIGRWPRFHEIEAWLDRHDPLADWRALDDAVFEFPEPCPQLIACHPQEGSGRGRRRHLRGGWCSEVQASTAAPRIMP